jgi:hypothetical protein
LNRSAQALLLLAALGSSGRIGAAQSLKPGEWFEDSTEVGFKVRLPQGWDFIPPKPGELSLLGRCDAGPDQPILAADPLEAVSWNYQMWIVRLDTAERAPETDPEDFRRRPPSSVQAWIEDFGPGAMRAWREDPRGHGTLKSQGLELSEHEFTETMGADTEVRLYAAVLRLSPAQSVALVFNGPGGSRWSQHKGAARSLAKTLRPLPLSRPPSEGAAGTPRERKRAALELEVSRSPQWKLYETQNYFVISNEDDQGFIEEALERLEAIRQVFQRHFPEEHALRLRARAAAAQTGGQSGAAEASLPAAEAAERARTSVVRICSTGDQYLSYGGPAGTGGYFHRRSEELVLFDDQSVRGRDATWSAMNHEAFHQYVHQYFGELAPHPWYNEGHGDYFGAFEYARGEFVPARSKERLRAVQEMLRAGRFVPLSELVRWTQKQYYGENALGLERVQCYAQGWSLVHFLRTGKQAARGWNDAWDSILDTYLEVLVTTRDLEQAVERAFAGVDWAELEACWRAATLD